MNAKLIGIEIDGRQTRRKMVSGRSNERFLIKLTFGGHPAMSIQTYITATAFRYLTILARACVNRDRYPDGWIGMDEFDPENVSRYMWRMKQELKQAGILAAADLIQNDRRGNYRLNMEADQITLKTVHLKTFPDHRVSVLFTSPGAIDAMSRAKRKITPYPS